ncbi:hypothetical protein ACH4ZU_07855 [Streptomyces sp. NPDC020472]|uniref:hypothetical protein n=1 Tax=Streptomyces sp. NPDC020472 TaxID=3365075 RepID=UPI0037B21475
MRITKRVRVVVTALTVATGTLAASAGSGVAAPPPPGRLAAVEIVKVEANVGDFWELSASCTMGRVAIGGGTEAGLSKSYPASATGSGAPNQWTVGGYGDGTTTATTAFAICADPITDLTVRRYNTTKIEYEPYGGLLKCPAGTSIVGGGASTNGPAASLYASRPAKASETGSQDGWWAQATDDQSDSNMDLYNMCAQTV